MIRRALIFALAPLPFVATAQQAPPEKALKYHEALLKRPHNAALFDRFFGAWLDELPVETLGTFLSTRAQANGGQDWTVLALYQLRRGQEEDALASMAKAIEAVPDDLALPMERAKVRMRRLEFEEARKDLVRVAEGKDDTLALEAAKLLGKSWLREGKTEEAVKVWDAVWKSHPNDEDLLEDLVETAAAEGETAQALGYIDKLITLGGDPYKKTLRCMRKGDILALAGRNDDAVDTYAGTLELVGEGTWLEREVLAQIEKIYRKQDQLDELTSRLKKLVEANPRRLLIHRQLAKLEAAQGEVDSAIGRFREVLQRSPGDRELREEFIRMLSDSDRTDDAVAELDKLIQLAPTESGLHLQLAALRHRQSKPDAVLAALRKAHEILGKDEGPSLRIAGLMLQYGQNAAGEELLKSIAAAPGAGPAATEALAAHFGRTDRKAEAIELLKKVAAADDADVVIRSTSAIAALGENETAFTLLAAKADKLASESRFLAALSQSALACGKSVDAVPHAIRLVRLAKQTTELSEGVNLAIRVINAAEKTTEWRTTLEGQASRTPAETCLLAALIESQGDRDAASKLLDPITDPMVIHFHAALLDVRGEFDQAIVVLLRLAESDEGRKAAYFKDLAELQQRAGKTSDALATVERWKQSAPGDKTAWITGSRLLRESGKPEEAVKIARQAVARFEGDVDLAASLASLQDESGQHGEAEAIYWRLYDEAQSPGDQTRWAAQLAQIATRLGRTDVLEEKLRERARSNRRSIGPVLAQAELARLTQNEEKYRELLLEAVRLQPKDIDLRLQIATLEEQGGNGERVIAILEEAIPHDNTGRIRGALAQAYLRQGQTLKGLRELRSLSGKQASDPRSIESSAATLAGSNLYDEAIQFIQNELPGGGDWRSRYLYAVLLEEDGRETEALPAFLSVLQAEGDLANLPAPKQPGNSYATYWKQYSPEVQDLLTLNSLSQISYSHTQKNSSRYYGGSGNQLPGISKVGPFSLPDTPRNAKTLALIHLSTLANKANGERASSIRAQVKATGNNLEFIGDLARFTNNAQPQDLEQLLLKYPNQPGLLEWVLMFSGNRTTPSVIRTALEKAKDLPAQPRFTGWMVVVQQNKKDEAAWTQLLNAAKDGIEHGRPEEMAHYCRILLPMYGGSRNPQEETLKAPEGHRATIKQLVFTALNRIEEDKKVPDFIGYRLGVMRSMGTPDEWLQALNLAIKQYRETPPKPQTGVVYNTAYSQILRYATMSGYNPWSSGQGQGVFTPPTVDTIAVRSIPYTIMLSLGQTFPNYGNIEKPPLTIEELAKKSSSIESPFLRAWIALKSGNAEATQKALAATPLKGEESDFECLRAVKALQDKKPVEAFAALERARTASASDREYTGWINAVMLGVASQFPADERSRCADSLRAILMQCRQTLGPNATQALAAQATSLGLDDIAKRLSPPVVAKAGTATSRAATFSGSRSSGSSSSGNTDKLKKFIAEGKSEAAAREALLLLRSANTNPWSSSYTQRTINSQLDDKTRDALLALTEPGDSKSLNKRLEYADVAALIGKRESMIKTLESLHAERPDDAAITSRLLFALPDDQKDRRRELMNRCANSDEFISKVVETVEALSNERDAKVVIGFYDTITSWLEATDPTTMEKANLTWASYSSLRFYSQLYNCKLPDLFGNSTPSSDANKELIEQRRDVALRLAKALVKYRSVSEEGFRLLKASTAWKLSPEELDEAARSALQGIRSDAGATSYSYFSLVRNNNSSGSSDNLDTHSSVAWVVSRLAETKNTELILPSSFREQVRKRDAKVGETLDLLAEMKSTDQIAKVLDADDSKNQQNYSPYSRSGMALLQQGLMEKAGTLPGSRKFFIDRIGKLTFDQNPSQMYQQLQRNLQLYSAALNAGLGGSDEDLDAVCEAIGKSYFGEKPNWENPESPQAHSYRISSIQNLAERRRSADSNTLMRFYRSWYRAGLPVSGIDYRAMQQLQKRFEKADEAEKHMEALGWLCDAAQWSPPLAYWQLESNSNGQNTIYSRREQFMFLQVCSQIANNSDTRKELVKRLTERKTGRFGSLITAAAISSEKERKTLTAQAFTECSAELAKLPPDKLDRFTLILPWVPEESVAKLPAKLRERVGLLEDKRRQTITKAVDAFLSQPPPPVNYGSSFDGIESQLRLLVDLDTDKTVETFIECERRFTTSLSQGAKLSSYSSDNFQVTERDEALYNILASRSSSERYDTGRRFQFLIRLQKHPEAGRLTYSPQGESYSGLIAFLGDSLQEEIPNEKKNTNDPALYAKSFIELIRTLPEETRRAALIAFICNEMSSYGSSHKNFAQEARKSLEPLRQTYPQEFPFLETRVGTIGWEGDTVEGREITRKALLSILNDQTIAEPFRVCLAMSCVKQAPGMLTTPDIASAIADLYDRYCSTERSAVNGWSSVLISRIGKIDLTPETLPHAKRMLDSFWKNANSPRVGGHPPIPTSFAAQLFSASASIGDEATAKRLLSQTGPQMIGDIILIADLISEGRYELAKALLPNAGQLYPAKREEQLPAYTKKLEEQLPKFLAIVEDPVARLRIQAQLLKFKALGDPHARNVDSTGIGKKLAAEYKANPPKSRDQQMEVLLLIGINDAFTTIDLADELTGWAKECDYKTTIRSWLRGNGNNYQQNQELYLRCQLTSTLMTHAALAGLLKGDVSILEKVTDAIVSSPVLSKGESQEYRGSTDKVVRTCHTSLINSSCLWLCIATARGDTAGFEKALACYEKLALTTDGRYEFEKNHVNASLATCHFLSNWIGQPQRFDQLLAQMKTRQAETKTFTTQESVMPLVWVVNNQGDWDKESYKDVRKPFLQRVLSREPMKPIFPSNPYWMDKVASTGMAEPLFDITEKPAELLPCVRSQMYWFRGRKLAAQNKPEDAIALFRQGLDAALPGADGDHMRGACKYELAKHLHKQKKTDEAKEILASIKPEESPDVIKGPYKNLITELKVPAPAANQTPAPAPAPPAPAPSKS